MTVKLIIEVREDGKVYATGPLHDKKLCIAMIEEAKSIVNNYTQKHIVIPGVKDLNLLKK